MLHNVLSQVWHSAIGTTVGISIGYAFAHLRLMPTIKDVADKLDTTTEGGLQTLHRDLQRLDRRGDNHRTHG